MHFISQLSRVGILLGMAATLAACGSGGSNSGAAAPGGNAGVASVWGGAKQFLIATAAQDAVAVTRGDPINNGETATDASGNVYVAGYAEVAVDGNTNAGMRDALVTKYDVNGNKIWTRQIGTNVPDFASGVATDAQGDVMIAGYSYGNFDGHTISTTNGAADIIVVKYDTNGNKLWSQELGDGAASWAMGVATDTKGNILIGGITQGTLAYNNLNSGYVNPNPTGFDPVAPTDPTRNSGVFARDAFVMKLDAATGNPLWTQQLGTIYNDEGRGVASDGADNVYLTGTSSGNFDGRTNAGLGAPDVFVTKFNANGAKQWTQLFGERGDDQSYGIAADGVGNTYITGATYGSLDGVTNLDGANGMDLFLTSYDTNGNRRWLTQMGSIKDDRGNAVTVDHNGMVYVAGDTVGNFDGNSNADATGASADAILVKFDGSSGARLWSKQQGTAVEDQGYGVASDNNGNVYLGGYTYGGLDGNTNAGDKDIFLMKFLSNGSKQ